MVKSPYRVEVEGHTDNRPIRERLAIRYPTNWELAGARSASVVRLLQSEGIAGTRMRVVSLAEFAPVASNDSDEGRAQNRRIEIRLRPAGEDAPADAGEAPAAAAAD
jgi:chemotaxis protein MotB